MSRMYLMSIKLPTFGHEAESFSYFPCIMTTMRTFSGQWCIGFINANDKIEQIKRFKGNGFGTLFDSEEEAQHLLDDYAAYKGLIPYEIRRMES